MCVSQGGTDSSKIETHPHTDRHHFGFLIEIIRSLILHFDDALWKIAELKFGTHRQTDRQSAHKLRVGRLFSVADL